MKQLASCLFSSRMKVRMNSWILFSSPLGVIYISIISKAKEIEKMKKFSSPLGVIYISIWQDKLKNPQAVVLVPSRGHLYINDQDEVAMAIILCSRPLSGSSIYQFIITHREEKIKMCSRPLSGSSIYQYTARLL